MPTLDDFLVLDDVRSKPLPAALELHQQVFAIFVHNELELVCADTVRVFYDVLHWHCLALRKLQDLGQFLIEDVVGSRLKLPLLVEHSLLESLLVHAHAAELPRYDLLILRRRR